MTDKSEIVLDTTPAPASESTPAPNTTYGGYESVEALVAAHQALKAASETPAAPETASKEIPQGDPATPPNGDNNAQQAVAKAGLDWNGLNGEYAEHGKLSDATYASLEQAGIPRAEVDTYIRGKQAEADAYDQAVYGAAGGANEYGSLIEWAKNALTPAEKDAFNEAVSSGNAAKAALAVEALTARRATKRGAPPTNLLNGTGAATGVQPYASRADMQADFRSARYKTDPAFRTQVVERMRLTYQ